MKNAVLWKRILNEGIDGGDLLQVGAERDVERRIITAPIIVGPPINPLIEGELEWTKYRLSIPFKDFWCEWQMTDGVVFGTLVETRRTEDEGFEFATTIIIAAPNHQASVMAAASVVLFKDGTLKLLPGGRLPTQAAISPPVVAYAGSAAKDMMLTHLSSVFELLTLLNCKNVSLDSRENDGKQIRRAEKRHGRNANYFRYHVLVIRPAGARSDAPSQELGIMPRHVCRGHFSEYGPEFNKGLLFGKYAGRFYVPPHLKGKKENGEVAKDYAIGGVA